ncbi:hypothetical protein B0J13DRAFT_285827 [Dactylonectria estremocensis]|uniref:Secreted protein n=1 Tax=Dactylonectria estremocensis TaxID=1079267 RepID=A0A9P9F1U6_9HYPO|nr:hypothetical protein B0J13DRAFT_285827 [Dactylonectria estremocensis]
MCQKGREAPHPRLFVLLSILCFSWSTVLGTALRRTSNRQLEPPECCFLRCSIFNEEKRKSRNGGKSFSAFIYSRGWGGIRVPEKCEVLVPVIQGHQPADPPTWQHLHLRYPVPNSTKVVFTSRHHRRKYAKFPGRGDAKTSLLCFYGHVSSSSSFSICPRKERSSDMPVLLP